MYKQIIKDLQKLKNAAAAKHLAGFFKTGKGQYGEGDMFFGINVPETRHIAQKYYKEADLKDIDELIKNPYHEARLCGFIILVCKFENGSNQEQKNIFEFYIRNLKCANNWDLVDLSASKISGAFLYGKDQKILYKLSRSSNLWEQRASIVSTYYFLKRGDFKTLLDLAEFFLTHEHDLIHKASGWMLREAGKADINILLSFLGKFSAKMPRTMLRYSIERLPKDKKIYYMTRKNIFIEK